MNREIKNKIKKAGMVAFLLYIAALIYFLFFSESYGRAGFAEREYHYNVVPFREIDFGFTENNLEYLQSLRIC